MFFCLFVCLFLFFFLIHLFCCCCSSCFVEDEGWSGVSWRGDEGMLLRPQEYTFLQYIFQREREKKKKKKK